MDVIGVIGAGQMGAGIAQVSAAAGYRVLLSDVSRDLAEQGKAGIEKQLGRQVAKEKIAASEAEAILARIETLDDPAPMAEAGLIVEAATEREEIKRTIFADVGKVLGGEAILATNTSSIPITRLAQAAHDPARFVGVHFFNPVPVMGLVELIRGLATSDATMATVEQYAAALGKRVVVANDAPGFIVNRILMPMLNEACFALGEGGGEHRRYRRRVPPRPQPPDGSAGASRFHRPRYVSRDHPRAACRHRRSQVPARSAAGQICRGGLVWAQDRARVLRLCRRQSGAHAVNRINLCCTAQPPAWCRR